MKSIVCPTVQNGGTAMNCVVIRRPAEFLRIVEAALQRDALGERQAGEHLLAVLLVEVADDLDGVVGIELADGLGDLLVRDRFEDFAADRVVDLGQRHPVEIVAHEADELVALVRLERLQHVAEIGFVQVADERAERLAVMPLDRAGDALDEVGDRAPPPRRGCASRPRLPSLVAVSVSTAALSRESGGRRATSSASERRGEAAIQARRAGFAACRLTLGPARRSPPGEAWCGREDSNLHGLPHSDLNAARLPVPPRPLELAPASPAGGDVANGRQRHKAHARPLHNANTVASGAPDNDVYANGRIAGTEMRPDRDSDCRRSVTRDDGPPVEWAVSDGLVPYPDAVAAMEARAAAIAAGEAPEHVWLLEHPPLYTAGTSAREADLLDAGALPGLPHRPRRRVHLSRAGPARRLCRCST